MGINKYQWNEAVDKAFCGKKLTLCSISEISKELFELAQKTDDYTKEKLIKDKKMKYTEVFMLDYETGEKKFYKSFLQVKDKHIMYDYHKLFVW